MTEEQKAKLIEERATNLLMNDGYVPNSAYRKNYTKKATEQLDWFRSHGLDIPGKDSKIKTAEDIFKELESKGENWTIPWKYDKDEPHFCFTYFNWNSIKTKYTKEVSHD